MRIGINTLFLLPGKVGGTEIYTRSLLSAMYRADQRYRYLLFTNRENHDSFGPDTSQHRRVRCPIHASNRPLRIVWEQLVLPWQLHRHRIDVLFSPGFTTPLVGGVPAVVTVHDLIWHIYPENFPASYRLFMRALIPPAARKASRIIAVSESTKRLFAGAFSVDPDRIGVIHEAPAAWLRARAAETVEPETIRRTLEVLNVRHPYLLTVSTLAPHKNLERLLAAFKEVRDRRVSDDSSRRLQLVLAGIKGRSHGRLLETANRLGLDSRDLVLTGWIEEQQLALLYRGAALFVYPSLHEGFGLPLLEAMEFGLPVACSRTTSLPEVGGQIPYYFDPENVTEMADVITGALDDESEARSRADLGKAWCRRFSWEKAAGETLDLICQAANRPCAHRDDH